MHGTQFEFGFFPLAESFVMMNIFFLQEAPLMRRSVCAPVRAHDITVEHTRWRKAFAQSTSEDDGMTFMLVDNLVNQLDCRLAMRQETSMRKAFCSERLSAVD